MRGQSCVRSAEERVKKLDNAKASCQYADRVKQGARNREHPGLPAVWPNRLETNPCIHIPLPLRASGVQADWFACVPRSPISLGFHGIVCPRFQPGRSQGWSSHFPSESSLRRRLVSPIAAYPVKGVKAGQAIPGAALRSEKWCGCQVVSGSGSRLEHFQCPESNPQDQFSGQAQSSHFATESSLPCRNLSPLAAYPVKVVQAGQAIPGEV